MCVQSSHIFPPQRIKQTDAFHWASTNANRLEVVPNIFLSKVTWIRKKVSFQREESCPVARFSQKVDAPPLRMIASCKKKKRLWRADRLHVYLKLKWHIDAKMFLVKPPKNKVPPNKTPPQKIKPPVEKQDKAQPGTLKKITKNSKNPVAGDLAEKLILKSNTNPDKSLGPRLQTLQAVWGLLLLLPQHPKQQAQHLPQANTKISLPGKVRWHPSCTEGPEANWDLKST